MRGLQLAGQDLQYLRNPGQEAGPHGGDRHPGRRESGNLIKNFKFQIVDFRFDFDLEL
jgi:hypothetical protein